jgi:putative two-component system response regulator
MEDESTGRSVLIIDDATNLRMLREILQPICKVYASPSGERALAFLEKRRPDLMLLDVETPGMNGYELLKRIGGDERFSSIPLMFLIGSDGKNQAELAFSLGAADYILKPVTKAAVRARVKLQIELIALRRRLAESAEETGRPRSSREAVFSVLTGLTALRDGGDGHLARVSGYTGLIASALLAGGDPDYAISPRYAEDMVISSKLHDIGNAAVSDGILLKPGKLTPEEFSEVKKHPMLGARIIDCAIKDAADDSSLLQVARELVVSHHEWWDGSGYPGSLSGRAIPISGRIVSLSDSYDALTSDRPFRRAMSHGEAMSVIKSEAGSHFDPRLIELLDDIFPSFPAFAETERKLETPYFQL